MSTRNMLKLANLISMISLISLVYLTTGCATGSKDSLLPQEGPTMKQVYDNHFSGHGVYQAQDKKREEGNRLQIGDRKTGDFNDLIARRRHDENNLSGYTRNAHNEIQQIFPRLKNKTLIMYIFPHLSQRERHPVPGYSTAFTLYKQTEYALPGEAEEGY